MKRIPNHARPNGGSREPFKEASSAEDRLYEKDDLSIVCRTEHECPERPEASPAMNEGDSQMSVILIADACKPSLVMSSEVFKDKLPGAIILVATTGKQCLELVSQHRPDMCVVDFDLPDADGVSVITSMRKTYKGPILLTAYPDAIVEEAVTSDLFAFNDAGGWVPKPVKFDVLSEKIDVFLLDKHRLGKRFDLGMETLVIGKGAGRGKRAPKTTGTIVNISMGGACIKLDEPFKMDGGQELTVALSLPTAPDPRAKVRSKTTARRRGQKVKGTQAEAKIKCTVAWVDKKEGTAGFQFSRLTEVQRRALETLLKDTADL